MIKKLIELMNETFSLPAGRINANTLQKDIEEWDSLGHLRLFLSIEQKFGLKFTMEEITSLGSVREIAEKINEKKK